MISGVKAHTTRLQWIVLDAIVRHRGFNPAAKALHMSQSSISYAVSQLQEALGVRLLQIEGRKAVLTANGRSLLEEMQPLLKGFQTLEERALILAKGGETELSLAVDSIFPEDLLFSALATFRASHPHVKLSLHRAIRLSPETAFSKHRAQVCIVAHISGQYLSEALLEIQMVAVAHRDHPLHRIKGIVRASDLNNHLLVAIEETSATQPLRSRPVLGETWHMNSIEAAIEAVRSGLCFGWLPKDRIHADLHSGKLQVLRLAAGKERRIPLFLLTPERSSPGPAAEHLSSILLDGSHAAQHENSSR